MRWWAAQDVRSDAQLAINNWKAAVPELIFEEAIDEIGAELVVLSVNCSYALTLVPGCTRWDEWFYQGVRDARYWTKTTIFVNTLDYVYAPGGITSVIAHELGHAFGLDERYKDDVSSLSPFYGSCRNETTVMDGMRVVNGLLQHCDDLQGPSSADVTRVRNYWSWGRLIDFTTTSNEVVLTSTYASESWAAERYLMAWVRYTPECNCWGGAGHDRIGGIGVHRITEYRLFTDVYDLVAEGQPPGKYKECGFPYFIMFNTYGTEVCSKKAVTVA